MPVVYAGPSDSADVVIKKFQRKVLSENILLDVHKKDFFIKKGLRRKMRAIAKRKRFV